MEAAVQLKEKHGGTTTVLTLGPPEAVEQLRYSISVGADQAVLVPADTTELDPTGHRFRPGGSDQGHLRTNPPLI